MKKVFILLIIVFIYIGSAFAYLGVTPSSYEIDFEPNLKKSFVFRFILPDDVNSEIFVESSLSEYINLDKTFLKGGGVVVVLLELPAKIEVPGDHIIKVLAMEHTGSSGGVSISLAVAGIIKLKVPYPGKYAELDLETQNANQGESVRLDLEVFSKGDEDIYATAYIDIFNGESFINRFELGSQLIEHAKSAKFSKTLETKEYLAGDYNATAVVNYGGEKPAISSKIFRLGHLFVGISDYTDKFEENKINRFVIEVESFWNEKIEDLYAEVEIVGYDEVFKTPSTSLDPWKKTTLTGFFDTTKIKGSKFEANITLNYHGETTSKLVELKLNKEFDYIIYLTIIVSIATLFSLLYLLKSRYRLVKNGSKK